MTKKLLQLALLAAMFWGGTRLMSSRPGEKYYGCTVLGKISAPNQSSTDFILILQYNNCKFDLNVTPATYWEAQVGSPITFQLAERQVCGEDDDGSYILGGLMIVVSVVLTVILIVHSAVTLQEWGRLKS